MGISGIDFELPGLLSAWQAQIAAQKMRVMATTHILLIKRPMYSMFLSCEEHIAFSPETVQLPQNVILSFLLRVSVGLSNNGFYTSEGKDVKDC